jgi:O-antigen ligase
MGGGASGSPARAATLGGALPLRPDGWAYLRARAAALLDWMVAIWVFSGFMVITEPSPYEVTFIAALGVAFFAGFGLRRSTLGLLVIFTLFLPFAALSAFQVRFQPIPNAMIFNLVTAFLILTAYFVANYVADAPQSRMRLIVATFTGAALLSAALGTLGYLGLIPGAESFTRFGRAKALFNDPNVYGPFLILPAMYALQRALLVAGPPGLWAGASFLVLFVGVFVSFSRAAWGHLLVSAAIVFVLAFALQAGGRQKVRMLLIALGGAGLLVVAIAGLLSIPPVQRLFETRFSTQTYDEGETGRFGRQGYAFDLALQNPLGIGPLEFRNLRVTEEPHNTYVSVLHGYGWGGGLLLYALIGATLWRCVAVFRPSPNRPLLIPLVATFIPLSVEAAIIDLDHWRHFFLIAGLIWGVTAVYDRRDAPLPARRRRRITFGFGPDQRPGVAR